MWIQRTPEEIVQEQNAAIRRARNHGLFVGIMAWLICVLAISSGWIISFSGGWAVEKNWSGTFWTRLPVTAVCFSPIIFIARHFESKKTLRNSTRRTICPKCDTGGEDDAGSPCQCGGTFVSSSTMKWIED